MICVIPFPWNLFFFEISFMPQDQTTLFLDLAHGCIIMCRAGSMYILSLLRKVLLLLLLSHFSRVRLCVTPQTAAHQAPLSLGFSRQEHWSELPFPSPMHESEKLKGKLLSSVRPLATPWTAAYQAPPSMGFSRLEYWSGVPLPSPFKEIGWY